MISAFFQRMFVKEIRYLNFYDVEIILPSNNKINIYRKIAKNNILSIQFKDIRSFYRIFFYGDIGFAKEYSKGNIRVSCIFKFLDFICLNEAKVLK